MLHWFHAYDHFNYARHFSYYWSTQQVLRVKHPSIYQNFKSGYFSTRHSEGKFNKVSPDQIIEQTIKKGPGKMHLRFFNLFLKISFIPFNAICNYDLYLKTANL